MKGELHTSKSRSKGGLRHLLPAFLLMDDKRQRVILLFSGVATPETVMGITM